MSSITPFTAECDTTAYLRETLLCKWFCSGSEWKRSHMFHCVKLARWKWTNFDALSQKIKPKRKKNRSKTNSSFGNWIFCSLLSTHGCHISLLFRYALRFVCIFLAIENVYLVHACIFLFGHTSQCIMLCFIFDTSWIETNSTMNSSSVFGMRKCFRLSLVSNWNQYRKPAIEMVWESYR